MAARLTLTLTDRREGKVSEAAMFQNYINKNVAGATVTRLLN